MAARGSYAKEIITQKILEAFEGSFLNGKELRIPFIEDGSMLQIKVQLTCAKENVEAPERTSNLSSGVMTSPAVTPSLPADKDMGDYMTVPTEEEKQRVAELLEKLKVKGEV